jgi:NAD(P)H-flavin reductase
MWVALTPCSNALLMRRPISIMSVDAKNGTFDLLYKVVGEGTRQLSQRKQSQNILLTLKLIICQNLAITSLNPISM